MHACTIHVGLGLYRLCTRVSSMNGCISLYCIHLEGMLYIMLTPIILYYMCVGRIRLSDANNAFASVSDCLSSEHVLLNLHNRNHKTIDFIIPYKQWRNEGVRTNRGLKIRLGLLAGKYLYIII